MITIMKIMMIIIIITIVIIVAMTAMITILRRLPGKSSDFTRPRDSRNLCIKLPGLIYALQFLGEPLSATNPWTSPVDIDR